MTNRSQVSNSPIIMVSVPILRNDLISLREKTGKETNKDAISAAIEDYLEA